MAGQLTISTLSDGTNSTSSTNCIQGSAKAWVNFNGNTGGVPSIRSSYNVSSVTTSGTGQYAINLTNALADANYSSPASLSINGSFATSNNVTLASWPASSSVVNLMASLSGTFYNCTYVSVSVFR